MSEENRTLSNYGGGENCNQNSNPDNLKLGAMKRCQSGKESIEIPVSCQI
jgi:hypothetical protein